MDSDYTLVILATGERIPVLPTPRLISEGTRTLYGIEAYQSDPASEKYPAIWRVRDDSYDAPGTEYQRVRIEVR